MEEIENKNIGKKRAEGNGAGETADLSDVFFPVFLKAIP